MRKIKFKNRNFILVGGALTTEDDYKEGIVSYAHLMDDGTIMRYGKVIGKKEDIEFGEEIENITPNKDAFFNLLNLNL